MAELLQDIRFGIRMLLKSRGYTAIAIAILGISIGATAAIYSFVDGTLLQPLPFANPERIVRLLEKPPGFGEIAVSPPNYLDWEAQSNVFELMAARAMHSAVLGGTENPAQLIGRQVTPHFFDIFGIRPALGRTFAAGEYQPGRDHVAILSDALWRSQFGADPRIVGRSIPIDGQAYTVVGVLSERGGVFDGARPQIWFPLSFSGASPTRDMAWLGAYARLKPGVTLDDARAQMDVIGARLAREYPATNKGWGVTVEPYSDHLIGEPVRQSLYLLLAAVGMILLIGCANLMNLTLAKGMARKREVSIRAALGAGRGRLVRQFLTESILLSIAGGAFGLATGYTGLIVLKQAIPPKFLPPEANVTMNGHVLLVATAVSMMTGIVFGLIPALRATRSDPAHSLKPNPVGAGAAQHRTRSILIVGEIALAFMLLTGAGLLGRSFFAIQKMDLGFDSTDVVTAGFPIVGPPSTNAAQFNLYLRQIREAVSAAPGVKEVAFASKLPLTGWGYYMHFQVAGQPPVDLASQSLCVFKMVSPSYFKALRIKLLRGRFLGDRDGAGAPPVAVMNETMARQFFADREPVGQHLLIPPMVSAGSNQALVVAPQPNATIPWEIVGVMADEKLDPMDMQTELPAIYVTNEQSPETGQGLIVRGGGGLSALQREIQAAVHKVNQDQALPNMMTLEQAETDSLGSSRFRLLLLNIFAGVAILLAAVGLYGVISYSVAQRTREIGIRMALGAHPRNILGMVVRGGLGLTGIGLAAGIAGAAGFARLLSSLLFGVAGFDPATLAAAAGMLAGVALIACYIPARRAGKVDPTVALRSE